MTGQLAYVMTYPVRESADVRIWLVFRDQVPAKSESQKASSVGDPEGLRMMPLLRVPSKYRQRYLTASLCSFRGSEENRAHWWTAMAMSGRVFAAMKFYLPMTER